MYRNPSALSEGDMSNTVICRCQEGPVTHSDEGTTGLLGKGFLSSTVLVGILSHQRWALRLVPLLQHPGLLKKLTRCDLR